MRERSDMRKRGVRSGQEDAVQARWRAYNVLLPMGDLQVKLQLTPFELPAKHHWVDKTTGARPSVAERLQRCGGPIVETQVDKAAFAAAKAAARADAMARADAAADRMEVDGEQEAAASPQQQKRKAAASPRTAARGSSSADAAAKAPKDERAIRRDKRAAALAAKR